MDGTPSKFDFGTGKAGNEWRVINDGVMGGLSKGQLNFTSNALTFKGRVSLENNGGFTSLKSPFSSYDFSKKTKFTIRYKLTGQKVAVTLEDSYRFYMPNYKLTLEKTSGTWKTLEVNMTQFKVYRMGEPMGGHVTKDILGQIKRVGFISGEKRAGQFELEVDYMKFE